MVGLRFMHKASSCVVQENVDLFTGYKCLKFNGKTKAMEFLEDFHKALGLSSHLYSCDSGAYGLLCSYLLLLPFRPLVFQMSSTKWKGDL